MLDYILEVEFITVEYANVGTRFVFQGLSVYIRMFDSTSLNDRVKQLHGTGKRCKTDKPSFVHLNRDTVDATILSLTAADCRLYM